MSEHQLSKITSGMVKPPINPNTGAYSTLHDEDRPKHFSTLQESYNEDVLAVDQTEPKGFSPVTEIERNPGMEPFNLDREKLTEQFYKKLQDLKNEHQKTLKMIELLHSNADIRCYQAENYPENKFEITVNKFGDKTSKKDYFFLTEDDSEGNEKQDNDEKDESDNQESSDVEQSREGVHFQDQENGRNRNEKIQQMWDDFNLRDYLPIRSIESIRQENSIEKRPKSAPAKKKEWSPVITIPQPFSMTRREEMKKEKAHTRSSEEVARAARERLEQEELEIKMRVRARDPPAHTYLPLFEEIMERREQRSRVNRENAGAALRAMVKPFSFMERERIKQELKNKSKEIESRKEKRKIKTMTQFVAKPVPWCVHDPSVAEQRREEELYRKIKNKMRSEDLMKSSALPPRMQSHEMMYAERRKKRTKEIKKANKLSFKPQTHQMPNFNELHRMDDLAKSVRKAEIETTMTEPFQFHTEALRKKKEAMIEANGKMREEEENYRNSVKSLRSSKKRPLTSDSIPARMTEAARLRLDETKRAIAKAEQELLELKLKERAQRERKKQMAQMVQERRIMADKDVKTPSDYRREKLKQYQMQQRARDAEYQKELKDMKDRLKQRPLLFEQEAQRSARDKAEKRYKEILRNSGLSDDMFDDVSPSKLSETKSQTFDDYSDDDEFEPSFNKSVEMVPKSSEKDGGDDTESDVQEEIAQSEDDSDRSRTSIKKQLDFDV